jgi:hypothetical protein
MTTNIVFVQDLALWLPLTAVAAVWLWRREPWLWRREPRGYLLGAASVVMGAIEGVSVATDQWYGHAADPSSTVVSTAIIPVFAALSALSLTVAWLLLRPLAAERTSGSAVPAPRRQPPLLHAKR